MRTTLQVLAALGIIAAGTGLFYLIGLMAFYVSDRLEKRRGGK